MSLFQEKVAKTLSQNLKKSNAMKYFMNFHKMAHRIAREDHSTVLQM